MDNENMENGVFNHGRIKDVDVKEEMKSSFLDYSMSVIISRALPDVRDGLNLFTGVFSTQCTKRVLTLTSRTISAQTP